MGVRYLEVWNERINKFLALGFPDYSAPLRYHRQGRPHRDPP